MGDMRFSIQYFYKPPTHLFPVHDDDVGTGSGVNVKTHQLRVNFGLTRFLRWGETGSNIQHGISVSNPAVNYFVPLQEGYKTPVPVALTVLITF